MPIRSLFADNFGDCEISLGPREGSNGVDEQPTASGPGRESSRRMAPVLATKSSHPILVEHVPSRAVAALPGPRVRPRVTVTTIAFSDRDRMTVLAFRRHLTGTDYVAR
jgi:hypothetical protein